MIPFHGCQHQAGKGHYESWFLRANSASEAQAFWIRYTLFFPADSRRPALGELWAIWFDGDKDEVVAVKQEVPFDQCTFSHDEMNVRIGNATLHQRALIGSASLAGNTISWQLETDGGSDALLFLPEKLYTAGLPKAKSLVSRPLIRFSGEFNVNGQTRNIDGWLGSENHNWGSKHTDQ